MHSNQTTIPQFQLKKIQSEFPSVKLLSSLDVYRFIKQFYTDDIEIFESAFILLVNAGNMTIGYAKISQGGMTSTVVDVRLIAKYAVESLAANVILAHNHPSGALKPSEADKRLTETVKQGLKFLDIKLLDHIILSTNGYFSFGDSGEL